MNNKKSMLRIVLVFVFMLIFTNLGISSIAPHTIKHKCTGEHCTVCMTIKVSFEKTRELVPTLDGFQSFLFTTVMFLILCLKPILTWFRLTCLISLKVQFNN